MIWKKILIITGDFTEAYETMVLLRALQAFQYCRQPLHLPPEKSHVQLTTLK